MLNTNAEISHWATPYDEGRIKRACVGEMTPLKLDAENLSAFFAESSGEAYETSLNSCTCVDYGMRGEPCKHMYRFAMELGLLPSENMVSDIDAAKLRLYMGETESYLKTCSLEVVIPYIKTLVGAYTKKSCKVDPVQFFNLYGECPLLEFPTDSTCVGKKQYKKSYQKLVGIFSDRIGDLAVKHLGNKAFCDMLIGLDN